MLSFSVNFDPVRALTPRFDGIFVLGQVKVETLMLPKVHLVTIHLEPCGWFPSYVWAFWFSCHQAGRNRAKPGWSEVALEPDLRRLLAYSRLTELSQPPTLQRACKACRDRRRLEILMRLSS